MFPLAVPLLAAAGSGLMTKLLNPSKGYKKAQEQNEKYYNQGQNYLQPYSQHGEEAYGPMFEAMQRLLNPEQLQNEWAEGYETSPYAKYLQEDASNQGLEAASQMGLMGSTPALRGIQAETSRIGAADRDKYMDALLQKYLHGAEMAKGIYGQGAQSAGQMSKNAMNMGQRSSEMAYGRQNAPGEMFSNLFGTAMGFGGNNMMGKGWSTSGSPSPAMKGPYLGGNYT